MIRRPQRGEDEEVLLRMQEEYLQEKSKDPNKRPAAQVTRLHRTEPTTKRPQTEDGTRKPSKYAQSKKLSNHSEKRARIETSTTSVMGEILEKNIQEPFQENTSTEENDKVYFPTVIPSVLGNIVEKNFEVEENFYIHPMPLGGFPEVTKRDPSIVPGQKSIHRQDLEMRHKECIDMEVDDPKPKTMISNSNILTNIPVKSYIVSSKEASDVHSENMKLLSSMSEKDILEEQHKLLTTLDPKLVEFIKSKRHGKSSTTTCNNQDSKKVTFTEEMDTPVSKDNFQKPPAIKDTSKIEDYSKYDNLWDNDVLTHPQVNKWLHFESLEKDKMEWMIGIEESKKIKPDEPYEARFDFTGYLLPYTIEYTEETKTLFHHGEESHRPGYSLNELIELSRSTITQQRVVALSTLAGILEYYNTGTYKDVLELPLSKLFFIIRIAVDENKVNILEPALKAMRNLLYNRIDEASLDALVGFEESTKQPWLENDKSEIEEIDSKESELKDFHLAEIDLIAAVLRTDILQRLYYILDTVRPSFNCVQYALQILTRLARDSVETVMKIIQCEHLVETIVKNFLPTTSINFIFDPQMIYKGKPILAAVKLLRILCVKSEEGPSLLEKYAVLKPISEYISSGVDGTYGLSIQIEAYCLLSELLRCGAFDVISLFPVVITTLYKHVEGTDIFSTTSILSATHAAVILQLLNTMLHHHPQIENYKTQIYSLLIKGTEKWIKQISQADAYTCAHLRLLCASLDCCTTALLIENIPIKFLNDSLKQLSLSEGFKGIIKNLENSSNLLSGLENKDLHFTKNLVSLGGSVIDSAQKVLPILNVTSPLPFLASLFKLLVQINDKNVAEGFLQQVTSYLQKLTQKPPALADNWFTRTEMNFVFNILKLATQNDLLDKDLFYAVANKVCYLLRIDKKYEICFLFNKIVFNKDWFTVERLLQLLNISDSHHEKGLENIANMSLNEIRRCYGQAVSSNCIHPEDNVYLLRWKEPILPRDWIYMPILALYSRRHELAAAPVSIEDAKNVTLEIIAEKKFILSCSLEWILFNEICFKDLLSDINVTDRFCRVMCVFLCDDSLFLDPKISKLLQKCTQMLFKSNAEFNFDKDLVGLHNFEDFYTEILQQFQSVSYGDPTFASCVLVPLAQRHNVKWRQLIWYEYVGCLRYLDCPHELLCYPLEDYLHPEETDQRVLESYHRALSLNYIRPDTVAHKIALHHMGCYKSRKSYVNAGAGASPR